MDNKYSSIKKRLEALENEEVEEIEDLREYYKDIYGEDEQNTSEQVASV